MSVENPNFLPEKYPDLPGSKPVERAVIKARSEGEQVPDKKGQRVEAYLERIEEIVSKEPSGVSDISGWDRLKHRIIKDFAIDTDDPDTVAKIAHGLYESEKKLAVEQGRGAEVEQLERQLQDEGGVIERYTGLVHEKRDIQQKTLSSWLDYLKTNDAQHPMWFRYFVVRNIQKMGTVDKERGEYSKRTNYTVAPFPELNSETLGFVYRMLTEGPGKDEFISEPEKRAKLETLVKAKDFAKLYAFAQIETVGALNKESIDGQWVKYDQGSDHHPLENALRGKGTGWCTAEGSAYGHLQGGDFYVYYTKNPSGQVTEPRIALRMEQGQVAEVRGVNQRQELEPELVDAAQDQYHKLPGGESYDKKASDMKEITRLTKKQQTGEQFTKDDLVFLYEIDSPIEGFGYEKDPRVAELRKARNTEQDMPVVLDCEPQQIARSADQINEHTKAYVGPLEPGIFTKILQYNIEHIYTQFPEGKLRRQEVAIGGKTKAELKQELETKGFKTGGYATSMMENKDFVTSPTPEFIDTIRLTVKDLGFTSYTTTREIYEKAEALGLDLCPAETGPHYRLQYTNQPMGEWLSIAMKPIADRRGGPSVFRLNHDEDGMWLYSGYAKPGDEWNPEYGFVFRLRKSES